MTTPTQDGRSKLTDWMQVPRKPQGRVSDRKIAHEITVNVNIFNEIGNLSLIKINLNFNKF